MLMKVKFFCTLNFLENVLLSDITQFFLLMIMSVFFQHNLEQRQIRSLKKTNYRYFQ